MPVTLVPLQEDELEWARQLHNDPEVLDMLTDPTIVTPEQQQIWYRRICNSNSSKRLVVWISDEERIGLVRVDNMDTHNHSVCVGLDIHKDYRGKGYAKVIYKKILEFYFMIHMNRVWLMVASYNERAISLYKSLGFKQEGVQREALYKNDKYHDYIIMSILKDEYDGRTNS